MSLPAAVYLLVFDELSEERREVVHELVKAKAEDWWHHMPNVWIVGGHNARFWLDELNPVIRGTSTSLLALRLPREESERAWGLAGPSAGDRTAWLFESYSPLARKDPA